MILAFVFHSIWFILLSFVFGNKFSFGFEIAIHIVVIRDGELRSLTKLIKFGTFCAVSCTHLNVSVQFDFRIWITQYRQTEKTKTIYLRFIFYGFSYQTVLFTLFNLESVFESHQFRDDTISITLIIMTHSNKNNEWMN